MASEDIRHAEVAAIERVFQAALTVLHVNPPSVAGPVRVETLGAAKHEEIAELQRVRDVAIRQAEVDHQQRLADAAMRLNELA